MQENRVGTSVAGIHGREKLVEVFGRWPAFHDAEVLRFTLDRSGLGGAEGPTAECTIHAFEMTDDVDEAGRFRLKKHVLVTLRFTEVAECEVSGFNHLNVLWDLEIAPGDSDNEAPFTVHFRPSYGFGGWFECGAVGVVRVEPCDERGQTRHGPVS